MPAVQEITSASSFDKAIGANKLTVVDCYATWCGPCKMVAPMFDALASKYSQVQCLRLDVEQQQTIAARYGVTAMPTFLFFRSGSKVDEVVGANIMAVEKKIQQYAGSRASSSTGSGYVLGSGKKLSHGSSSDAVINDQMMTRILTVIVIAWILYAVFF